MITWIVLLRGVNVGGHNKLPMADFRDMLTRMGYGEVRTYIQSGNAIISSSDTAETVARDITKALKNQFDLEPDVVAMTVADLNTAIAVNPFPEAENEPTLLHLSFFPSAPVELDLEALKARAKNGEEFRMINGVFYFHTPNGFGRSPLAGKLTSLIKSPMTARNLRSCLKIAELAGKQ